jgi:DNA-directed RNA polymerase specialized sigma24 family protein
MLILTPEDQRVIELLARECSREGEGAETTKILMDGFSLYGEEALSVSKKKYASREEFFKDKCELLLENIRFAGQTFEQAFASKSGRDCLCKLVRCTGVPSADIEDIVQEISRRFWRVKWVERYNPLISTWRNFLLVPIQRYVITYRTRRNKKVITNAVRLSKDSGVDENGATLESALYDINQNISPEDNIIRQEIIEDWESYLRSQKPIRTVVYTSFKKMCTLLPPGMPEIPTEEEKDVFFLRGGIYNSRVTTKELCERDIFPVIPNYLLVDYIAQDLVDCVPYVDETTGDFVTQKDFPNPDYDPSAKVTTHRTWMDLYILLMQNFQIEEIARELKVVPPSVPARIKKLESMFRDFWIVSVKIPRESKLLAAKTYQCPNCYRLDLVRREDCRVCGADMRNEVAKVRFDGYPWHKVYGKRETYERLGGRRQALMVQRCSVSVKF